MHINVLKQTYDINIPDKLNTLINVLEEEFIKYANNLEFIEAKIIRDEINALKAL
jgi:protein-arginine kinase activator protein McsA